MEKQKLTLEEFAQKQQRELEMEQLKKDQKSKIRRCSEQIYYLELAYPKFWTIEDLGIDEQRAENYIQTLKDTDRLIHPKRTLDRVIAISTPVIGGGLSFGGYYGCIGTSFMYSAFMSGCLALTLSVVPMTYPLEAGVKRIVRNFGKDPLFLSKIDNNLKTIKKDGETILEDISTQKRIRSFDNNGYTPFETLLENADAVCKDISGNIQTAERFSEFYNQFQQGVKK